ncbi:MAG TPA: hypothetical protein VKV37_20275 [Ktedonobacteraceae bacterium]|nr:hypothetical protein [Ktedonobacteraceae bacterium]
MSKSTNQSQTKQKRRSARREEQRRREEQQRQRELRRRRITIGACVVAAVLVIAAAAFFFIRQTPGQTARGSNSSSASATQTQSVSDASTNPAYATLAGIPCQSNEQLTYHIHAHLSIYIDGKPVQVPQYVGIASDGSCFYWLHTHDTSGVIHIEAPGPHTFTLGTFLQLWSERFAQLGYPIQLDQVAGWQAYVNGRPYTGDFHAIPLNAHALITLAYNSPGVKPDTTYAWQGL